MHQPTKFKQIRAKSVIAIQQICKITAVRHIGLLCLHAGSPTKMTAKIWQ